MVSCLIISNDKHQNFLFEEILSEQNIILNRIDEDNEISLNKTLELNPQIVFINLDSKQLDISELLLEIKLCEITQPYLIAISSQRVKAFDAYKFGFSDFLLKPFSEGSIRRILYRFQKINYETKSKKICIKSYKDYQYLVLNDILFLKADNNTTDFYMSDGRVIGAFKTLKTFEKKLPKNFLRIHKSYIINKSLVSRVNFGKFLCEINNKHKIPFTKTFQDNINLINQDLKSNAIVALN